MHGYPLSPYNYFLGLGGALESGSVGSSEEDYLGGIACTVRQEDWLWSCERWVRHVRVWGRVHAW